MPARASNIKTGKPPRKKVPSFSAQKFPEFLFVKHAHAKLPCLVELAPRVFATDEKVQFLRN